MCCRKIPIQFIHGALGYAEVVDADTLRWYGVLQMKSKKSLKILVQRNLCIIVMIVVQKSVIIANLLV